VWDEDVVCVLCCENIAKGIFMIAGFYNLIKKTYLILTNFSSPFQDRKAVRMSRGSIFGAAERITYGKIAIFIIEITLKNNHFML